METESVVVFISLSFKF